MKKSVAFVDIGLLEYTTHQPSALMVADSIQQEDKMTHEELLAKIGNPIDEGYEYGDIVFNKALRVVVELHEPNDFGSCRACGLPPTSTLVVYPCKTIQAIEEALA
jgi:hypothetical protein